MFWPLKTIKADKQNAVHEEYQSVLQQNQSLNRDIQSACQSTWPKLRRQQMRRNNRPGAMAK